MGYNSVADIIGLSWFV